MDYKILLEKYWAGETTLAEEKALKAYFNGDDVVEELLPYATTFQYFSKAQKQTLDTPIENLIATKTPVLKVVKATRTIYLRRIAAAVGLLLMIGFGYQILHQPTKAERVAAYWKNQEIKDPKLAIAKTKAALLLVSNKLNEGKQTALQQLKAVRKLGQTIRTLE